MRRRGLATAVALAVALVAPRAWAQPVPTPEESPPADASGKLGHGFTLRAGDDSAHLNIRVRSQFQAFVERNPKDPATGDRQRPDIGLMIRRLRLVLQGHVFSENIHYYLQFGFSPRDQEDDLLVPVRDAQLIWTAHRDLAVRVGQMKVPLTRERVISSSALGMVDRSNVNAELSLDRDIGIMLQSRDLFGLRELLRYSAGVFGGDGRNRTTPNTGLLYAARIEVAPFGSFDDYSGVDFKRTWKPRLALGFATAYSEATPRERATTGATFTAGTVDYRHGSADVILKLGGLSLQSEVVFRRASVTQLTRTDDTGVVIKEHPRSAWGYMTQAGVMWTDHWETSLRYGEVRPLDDSNPKLLRDREIGGGLSYYFQKHDLKVQLDYFRLLTDADHARTSVEGRNRVRLQAQFYF